MKPSEQERLQKSFGTKVRKLRKELRISQEELALAADLDRTYVGGVERGERNISLVNIVRIAEALGVSLGHLFSGVECKANAGVRMVR